MANAVLCYIDAQGMPAALAAESEHLTNANFVWDTGSLAWVRMTQPGGGGGGGMTDAEFAVHLPLPIDATDLDIRNLAFAGDKVDVSGSSVGITGSANPATAAGKSLTFVLIAQGAAGTTVLAAASASNKHKLLGCALTMSADGTLKFLDGVGDLSGALDIAAKGGFVLPTSILPFCKQRLTQLSVLQLLAAPREGLRCC